MLLKPSRMLKRPTPQLRRRPFHAYGQLKSGVPICGVEGLLYEPIIRPSAPFMGLRDRLGSDGEWPGGRPA